MEEVQHGTCHVANGASTHIDSRNREITILFINQIIMIAVCAIQGRRSDAAKAQKRSRSLDVHQIKLNRSAQSGPLKIAPHQPSIHTASPVRTRSNKSIISRLRMQMEPIAIGWAPPTGSPLSQYPGGRSPPYIPLEHSFAGIDRISQRSDKQVGNGRQSEALKIVRI